MKQFTINGFHNLSLNCYLFEPKTKAKAVIQIIHGMQEHALRYVDFAEFLAKNGYIVLASDLRGHGHSLLGEKKNGFGEKDIYAEIIEDQTIICDFLKEKYNLPIFVFGHSFGSFITQGLMQENKIIKKFVLCGTTDGSKFMYKAGKFLAGLLIALGQKNNHANIMEGISLRKYGKKFKNGNWLSRDEDNWERYLKDPLRGYYFPVSFYRSMLKHLTVLNKSIYKIPDETPIFLIAGDKDPVGKNAKYVQSLYETYKKCGKNVKIKIYPECRHELINELNKEEVYNDVLDFFNK
ncbi:MAG: alpha/beta fold hydrolase [Clostridia bacterium]|nr:alpha/beta fold hydrolase [Clostridia bacterium]